MFASTSSGDMTLAGQGDMPTEWGDEDQAQPLAPRTIAERLAIVFSWIDELFQALDLESKNVIDLSRSGASIYKVLSDLNLQQLWETMTKAIDHESIISPDQFVIVVLAWTGIDDTFELANQRSLGNGADPIT